MKAITAIILTAILGFAASASAEIISCSSRDHERNFCRANTRGGVKLVKQESHAGCWQGDSWGWNRDGVWVANGCRATFRVGYEGSERVHSIQYNHGSGSSPNWNDRDDVRRWDREHRDDHENKAGKALGAALAIGVLAAAADEANRHDGGRSVYRCESQDDHHRYCSVGERFHHVEVKRQLSRSNCRYQRDWGYDRRGIWVDNGCRAEFWVE